MQTAMWSAKRLLRRPAEQSTAATLIIVAEERKVKGVNMIYAA
jgi:hypothetical protein